MSRRHSAEKREVIPDAKYGDVILTKFMNSIMYDGKKSIAEAIVYDAFDIIEQKMRSEPLPVFKQALDNVAPAIEVRSRRVGAPLSGAGRGPRGRRRLPFAGSSTPRAAPAQDDGRSSVGGVDGRRQ
jgi:small subunit ribosomal protein S7